MAQHTSPNYRIEESTIGPGGLNDANSSNYNLRASLGDLGVGNSTSTNFQLYGGFTTTDEEYLEFVVNGAIVDLGLLSDSTTGTGSATFYVRSYLSNGYVVSTVGDPPANSAGETLDAKSAQGAPITGTEEFGINLKANTSPTTFGAEPQQVPDSSFSFGYVSTGYNTANQFKYTNGDIIAQADSSSGQTTFTISYIANIALLTPAGLYTMDHVLVATATF
ncbi:MAG TPA: hypothetical protein VGA08_03215 [Candidatus Saccharimonadales bacterium]